MNNIEAGDLRGTSPVVVCVATITVPLYCSYDSSTSGCDYRKSLGNGSNTRLTCAVQNTT